MAYPPSKQREGRTLDDEGLRARDRELVDRCLRGEMSAFEEIYRMHSPRLYAMALRMVGSQGDAEDVLQEIFLQVYRKLSSFRGDSTLGTWLYKLGVNQCLDALRKRKGMREETFGAGSELANLEPGGRRYVPGDIAPTRIDLERAIAALPDRSRAAFLLHDVEGFGHHEIANLLGIAEGTSKSQVHKARLRIRAWLSGPVEVD